MDACKQAALNLDSRFLSLVRCGKGAGTAKLEPNHPYCSSGQVQPHKAPTLICATVALRIGPRIFSAEYHIPGDPVIARFLPGLLDLVQTYSYYLHAIQHTLSIWSTACALKFR